MLALQTSVPPALQHFHAGVEAEKNGQLDTAVVELRKATELDSTLAVAFADLGGVYIEKRDYSAAIPPLKRALELNPGLNGAHRLLGYALLAQGYATEAIPHLEQAHAEDALGIALLEAGKLPEALAVLEKALAQNPNDPELLYYYGRTSGLLSKQIFDELEARFPDSARAHQMMAQDYAVLRDVPGAEREFFEALRLSPQTAGLHLQLGELYARAQQWDKAEEQFRLETGIQSGSAEAFYRLGEALLQLGKFHEAREALVHSDQLRQDMPETLYQLGKAAAMDGDDTTAQKSWKHLLSLEKDTSLASQAHFGLAGIYRKQGKHADADREMEEFRKSQSKPAHTDDSQK
ncbi:tetratricopeptide (TPR) repeat protein [Silvibacterium bohemicum]|uniref:Tetratricopeptide (TPR) repeat protein n=1 Tax=Silvibacterium bohemicum TaxID=1577686 RepID=A0A841JTP2_9BACT|nr:tetratricopeptide repeat protein [Silvibacterium bohemicum]MBB6143099.1 tetratricopeptide (TPR) repeat protein [Silvibacterium bohemicum]